MRRIIVAVALAVGVTIPATVAVAVAHHGAAHVGRYRQIEGPSWMPERIVIRCAGWAEDSATLIPVDFSGDRVVYRCVTP